MPKAAAAAASQTPEGAVLRTYPVPLIPGAPRERCIDLFNARKALVALLREASGEKRPAASAAAAEETPEEKAKRERAECGAALSKYFTYTPQHVPGGAVMQKVSTFTYITPNGPKALSRQAVEAALKEANRSYITDLLEGSSVDVAPPGDAAAAAADADDSDSSDGEVEGLTYMRVDAAEVLSSYSYHELDEMRFALVAIADLVSRGIFDADGRMNGLAKRDMKRHYQAYIESQQAPKQKAEPAPAAAAATGGGGGKRKGAPGVITAPKKMADEDKPQKNLKALLEDRCQTLWPYTPPEKAAVYSVESDPDRPRHKPLFRGSVMITPIKRKFDGEWMPIKRDAENSAAEQAVAFLAHYKGK